MNVLNNKKRKSKKQDKLKAAASADQSGGGVAVLASDVSDGTDEAEGVTQECGNEGALHLAADAVLGVAGIQHE